MTEDETEWIEEVQHVLKQALEDWQIEHLLYIRRQTLMGEPVQIQITSGRRYSESVYKYWVEYWKERAKIESIGHNYTVPSSRTKQVTS